ncbi:aromatic acid/H+ symport family MFS transporter [Streptomyces caniscabiei]|uniref:MFS transporter n=1 Tax=Streptomyces caniscabiei TaxID=2746961 RepID=UPI0029A77B35|nr:aromatic acid/H+ symport family MFS transporter [Streptomyces caniscabiei]MDX2604965.1 aromatic acid/H+ symport family MFS transporter [Streptomyces caniscabiei]MDX2733869.1 aromatic acid/H+ symport family MFS transporter [Streptomyces caniscabiei]MDX2777321.1 aromatic acid/H+ symport family MFS transporter [Streptomyces caniscabiei]
MLEDSRGGSRGQTTWPPVTVLVLAICGLAIVADGYDVVIYGAVIPSLLHEGGWGLTPAGAGLIGSFALIGMLIGATTVGTLTDTLGRRKTLIACLTWFSVMTGLCATATSPELFGFFRFLAGLGLGGVLPTASALSGEYSHPKTRNLVFAIIFSGFPVGGIIAALVGMSVIPQYGWQAMFLLGLLPLILVVPVALKFLPESITFLRAKGRHAEAEKTARRWNIDLEEAPQEATTSAQSPSDAAGRDGMSPVKALFSRDYVAATLCFLAMSCLCLFMIYGYNTWLPEIMRRAGYSSGSALGFLLMFNLGAVVGQLLISFAADRLGSKPIIVTTYLLAGAAVILLSLRLPTVVLYAAVAMGGVGAMGTQTFLLAHVSKHYPVRMGATALGWALGFGRIGSMLAPPLLGLIIWAGLAYQWNFYALAVPGLIGAVLIGLVPRAPGDAAPATRASADGTARSLPEPT